MLDRAPRHRLSGAPSLSYGAAPPRNAQMASRDDPKDGQDQKGRKGPKGPIGASATFRRIRASFPLIPSRAFPTFNACMYLTRRAAVRRRL